MPHAELKASPTPPDSVPLIVGVTGHRDLLDAEMPLIKERVRGFFTALMADFPGLPILVITPLAEGADRLVAEVASELELSLIILLPMPRELYEKDFADESISEFDAMARLGEIVELPLVAGNSVAAVSAPGHARDLQYARLGVYVAAHSHILLALWDGQPAESAGGTAHVVQFHQHDVVELLAEDGRRSPIDFAEDESDLVCHVTCSREAGGGLAEGLQPGAVQWLTRDDENPRTATMPDRYRVLFGRMLEFNADLDESLVAGDVSRLLSPDAQQRLSRGATDIERLYRHADVLASRYQRLARSTQLVSYAGVVCAMLSFIVWADLPDQWFMIYPYLIFILLVIVVVYVERRQGWQRRYIDYRVLAEGLRVQFWWCVGGVAMQNPARFSHDCFLRRQDLELGWIRNVMRYAGRRADAQLGDEGCEDPGLVAREWVAHQSAYYSVKSNERYTSSRITSALVLGTFAAGLVVGLLLAGFQFQIVSPWSNGLVALMGLFPLLAAVRQGYANRTAERELITQYGYQYRIFANADRLLRSEDDGERQREILRALGESALDEHGQWMLLQRERPVAGQVLQGG
ncbi:MAG: DUF4231 domain-containing protein [Gammaproteobacteria bacterium]|nr:DUF4231 domain-containing protein [Gammaproteobacteria bacterium]